MKPLTRRLAALILTVSPFVCFWKIFLAHSQYSFFTSNDAAQHWYPWYQYLGRWISNRTLPLWDQALQSGRPLLGEMRPGVLYPFNLLMAFFTSTKQGLPLLSMDLLVVLAVVMASLFEYRLARYLGQSRFSSVLSAVAYGYAGFVVENATWQIAILNGIVWMPLLTLLFLKARQAGSLKPQFFFTVSGGVVLGLMILAGHIEPPIHATLFLAFLAIYLPYSRSGRLICTATGHLLLLLLGTILTAGLLAAPQLLPALEYGRHSLRWLGWDALAPVEPMKAIPYAWGGHFERGHLQDVFTGVDPGLWAGSDYFGVVPVILAVTAFVAVSDRRARIFKIGIVLSILLWLGETSIVHGLLYQSVPLLDKVRQPSRAIFLIHFCLATLAGFGADSMARAIPRTLKQRLHRFCLVLCWAGGIAAGLIVVASLLAILFKAATMTDESLEWTLRFAFMTIAALTLIYMRQSGLVHLRAFRAIMLFLVAFDLFSFFAYSILPRQGYNNRNNFFPTVHYAPNDAVRFLAEHSKDELFRVEVLDGALPMNSGMVHGFQEITGFTATGLRGYQEFRAIDWAPQSIVPRLLNRRYLVSRDELAGFRRVVPGSPGVYEDPESLARVRWVPHARLLRDSAAVTDALRDRQFDPRAAILVSAECKDLVPPDLVLGASNGRENVGESGSAKVTNYGPNSMVISSTATAKGVVLLSEIFYPGWKAMLDGSPVPIIRADLVLRAIAVPAGEHVIEVYYWPTFFTLGISLSVAAWTLFAILALMMIPFPATHLRTRWRRG